VGIEPVEWAYAAGLFDGEGCIHISKRNRYHDERRQYGLKVELGNTNRDLLHWLFGRWGGGIHKHQRAASAQHRDRYRWSCPSGRHEEFLRGLRPYLVAKAGQADNALAFLALLRAFKGGRRSSSDRVAQLEHFFQRGRRLNLKGPHSVICGSCYAGDHACGGGCDCGCLAAEAARRDEA
jgi:hypothetical protein